MVSHIGQLLFFNRLKIHGKIVAEGMCRRISSHRFMGQPEQFRDWKQADRQPKSGLSERRENPPRTRRLTDGTFKIWST
jgi:hypothetical protein